MNSIRFLMTWAAIEPQKGVYDDAYLDAVATRIEWAKAANLLVVLDMHDDVYGEGFVKGGGDGAPMWTCDASNYASFRAGRELDEQLPHEGGHRLLRPLLAEPGAALALHRSHGEGPRLDCPATTT